MPPDFSKIVTIMGHRVWTVGAGDGTEREHVWLPWREAMQRALYGPAGFFVYGGGPARHFRTSVHESPLFTAALLRLIERVDRSLGRPDPLEIVDIGAGRGELLLALSARVPAPLAARLRLVAVELAPRPGDLSHEVEWRDTPPDRIRGVLVATEWLDNVPVDLAETGEDGVARYLLVDPRNGTERPGDVVAGADAQWLARWWPQAGPGSRAEIGRTRDAAWASAVSTVAAGVALAVDYGNLAGARPLGGTLTGFSGGRQVPPIPDGSCDVTAHVAMDAVAAAGGEPYILLLQREALRALGVAGTRPPLSLASIDPAGYVKALAAASAAAELTDPAGLGGHYWLLHLVGVPDPLSG